MYKICGTCKKHKPLWAFYYNRNKKFGVASSCKICQSNYGYKHYRENIKIYKEKRVLKKEKQAEYGRKWYQKNKEQHDLRNRVWAKTNPEVVRVYKKQWKLRNKHIVNENTARRRAAKRKQKPVNTNECEIKFIYNLSTLMNRNLSDNYHVDHIVPLNEGGLHHQNNLQILTAHDNLKKGNKISSKYRGVTVSDVNLCTEIVRDILGE